MNWLLASLAKTVPLVSLVALGGCGGSSEDPAAQPATAAQVGEIQKAIPNPVTPVQVAEAFALGSNSTDLQRELIRTNLVGSVVEWDLPVYDVEYADGVYTVTSQAIPIESADAVKLLRVVAFVTAQDKADDALMQTIKTNDVVRLRGRVQDILLRTVVEIRPAIVAHAIQSTASAQS